MKTILSLFFVLLLSACPAKDRSDEVPATFSVRNSSTTTVAILLFGSRTHNLSNLPSIITDVEFTANQVNPGSTKVGIDVPGYQAGDSVYFQVYARNNGINGVTFSKLYNYVEIIRQKKLLVYQSP